MGTSFPGIIPIPIVEIFRSFLYVQVTPESVLALLRYMRMSGDKDGFASDQV